MILEEKNVVEVNGRVGFAEKLKKDVFQIHIFDEASQSFKVYKNVTSRTAGISKSDESKMSKELKAHFEKVFKSLKKDDWVQFKDDKDNVKTGLVSKGGRNPVVIYENGTLQCSGPAHIFSVIDKPVIEDADDSMKDWGILGYKEYPRMSEETTAFNAYVTHKGKKVFAVENSGKGSCNDYMTLKPEYKELMNQFESDLKQWKEKYSKQEKVFEIESLWLEWFTQNRSLGQTAQQYWSDFDKLMS